MSTLMAQIWQKTVTDTALICWFNAHFKNATYEHQQAALNTFEDRAEQLTIQTTLTDFLECVYPTTYPIPGKTVGRCHPTPEYR